MIDILYHLIKPNDLAVAMLTTVIVSAIAWIGSFSYKQISISVTNRKYPIAGNYMTRYEDIDAGEKVWKSAPAKLTQRGFSIKGTTEITKGKSWKIDATLKDGGLLYGLYFADSPHDSGTGNFFLSVDQNGDMEGIWSGYDSVNRIVSSGRYMFNKIPHCTIAHASSSDHTVILSISSRQLGEGYLSNIGNNHPSDKSFMLVAKLENQIAGFSYCYMVPQDGLDKEFSSHKVKISPDIRYALENGTLGILKTIAVDDHFKSRGIGYKLVAKSLHELKSMGCTSVISVAWQAGNDINIGGVLEKHRFEKVTTIPDFWTQRSIDEGFDCPQCGNPCHCSGVIFKKSI